MKEEYSFLSSDRETLIHAVEWKPETEPKGVIVIAHGITEHIGRYESFAKIFLNIGFVVAGYDQIGHGLSVAEEDKKMCIGNWEFLVQDLKTCVTIEKKHYPDLPFYLLGFSLGSFVVRDYLNCFVTENSISDFSQIAGAIIIGTGMQSRFVLKLARKMVEKEIRKNGAESVSDYIDELAFGNYNKQFKPNKTRFDWLCASECALKEYQKDPLTAEHITPGYFHTMLSGMIRTADKAAIKNLKKELKFLVLSGQDDPVGENSKGVHKYTSLLEKNGLSCKEKIYPGMRHDILHEKDSLAVLLDIKNWLA